MEEEEKYRKYYEAVNRLLFWVRFLLFAIVILLFYLFIAYKGEGAPKWFQNEETLITDSVKSPNDSIWQAPDTSAWQNEPNVNELRYGRNLIANTAHYYGPKGTIQHSSNGMNCQNCHLDAGTKAFGNNYGAVYSTYPKFRERSGKMESIPKRINDCFMRSLNGQAIDSNGKEMKAMVAYMKWLGKDVKKGERPKGAGLKELNFLNRAASPENGKTLFAIKCVSCHQANGAGKKNSDSASFQYPPLWGINSYNRGAGLHRIIRFSSFIKYNMPQGATFKNPQLSDEEAWDIAAFVNSQERPNMDLSHDWPNLKTKPIDYPYGPYADKFTEQAHKYGPFEKLKKK